MFRPDIKQTSNGKSSAIQNNIHLWEALDSTLRTFERDLNQELGSEGLSRTSFLILDTLSKSSSPVSTQRLRQTTGLMPAAMSGMLTRMEAAQLCYRVEDSSDQRVVLVQISPIGESQLLRATRAYEKWILQRFGSLSSTDGDTLRIAAEVLRQMSGRLVNRT